MRPGDCRPATVTVDVGQPPQITSVTPNPTPPNREVEVTGTTGPCREGTLRLRIPQPGQDDVEVAVDRLPGRQVRGAAEGSWGTFVGTYTLELRVDCARRERVAKATLEVRNQRPVAVDDRAQTARAARSPSTSPATTPIRTATTATGPPWRPPSRPTAGPRCCRATGSATPLTTRSAVARTRSPTPSARPSTPTAGRTATAPPSP